MVKVKKQPGQSDDQLIRTFSRKVSDADIIREVRRRQFHLNKQEKKKMLEQEARRARRKAA